MHVFEREGQCLRGMSTHRGRGQGDPVTRCPSNSDSLGQLRLLRLPSLGPAWKPVLKPQRTERPCSSLSPGE